jgi:selenide,water dikinase
LIVLGFVDPARMITKAGARAGDVLVLSKPLGFGTTTTALKRGQADPTDVSEVVGWMKRLNKVAAELAMEAGVRGGTDVTGFSLLGHAWEMAEASGVGLRFSFEKIPFTRGAHRYAQEWIFPGGSSDNRLYFSEHVQFDPQIDEPSEMLLFDAQTSGGLLLSVPPEKLRGLLERAAQVGQVLWQGRSSRGKN